jgi:hypothetical protein
VDERGEQVARRKTWNRRARQVPRGMPRGANPILKGFRPQRQLSKTPHELMGKGFGHRFCIGVYHMSKNKKKTGCSSEAKFQADPILKKLNMCGGRSAVVVGSQARQIYGYDWEEPEGS